MHLAIIANLVHNIINSCVGHQAALQIAKKEALAAN
jgi:uncharacterized protein YejL (UPF0352 family)